MPRDLKESQATLRIEISGFEEWEAKAKLKKASEIVANAFGVAVVFEMTPYDNLIMIEKKGERP